MQQQRTFHLDSPAHYSHYTTRHPLWLYQLRRFSLHWRLLLVLYIAFYLLTLLFRFLLYVLGKGPRAAWDISALFDAGSLSMLWGIGLPFTGLALLFWLGMWARWDMRREQIGGCTLRNALSSDASEIYHLVWSPDGRLLAFSTSDKGVWIWDTMKGKLSQIFSDYYIRFLVWSPDGSTLAFPGDETNKYIFLWHIKSKQWTHIATGHRHVTYLAWSPDSRLLASVSGEGNIWLWDAETKALRRSLPLFDYASTIRGLVWSPDGSMLASCSDVSIHLWNVETGSLQQRIHTEHQNTIRSLAWSPNGRLLASGSQDKTVRLWDCETSQTRILEGYTDPVTALSFSADGCLLISSASSKKSASVIIWRTNGWERVATLNDLAPDVSIAVHPCSPVFATLGKKNTEIFLWDLDLDTLLHTTSSSGTVHYTNARVVLVGDSGVGKSGLGLVLVGQHFKPTESTHGRRVWTLSTNEVQVGGRLKETREILLWDLAGQPGYRLIHQLHLNEVTVALVVFDARSETDPFAGVRHWDHALRQAHSLQGNPTQPLKKFLVAARTDRGGIGVSPERVQAIVHDFGFDGYFETSAKEGHQVAELKRAILESIPWEQLPTVSSSRLFRDIKTFLLDEKKEGRLMSTADDLYELFRRSKYHHKGGEHLREQFETCIGRVESAGLIKRLSFGNLVLLQPELLDAYASALVNAVKDEPDGLGSISEERVRSGDFRMPTEERLKNREQEKLLLIAMIEDLLRRELVWREGPTLVFPSQSTREYPHIPEPQKRSVIFAFEGPVLNIYATLVVRLAQSGLFRKKELWKNAVTYTASVGGMCGIFLRQLSEEQGELTLFFDEETRKRTLYHFEEFIFAHLQRRALPESVKRRQIFVCHECGTLIPEHIVQLRLERRFEWLSCPVCESRVSLVEHDESAEIGSTSSFPYSRIREMDHRADQRREREAARSILQGKRVARDFDVFLCHHGIDKPTVKRIGGLLKERGILPWLDEWELRPGLPWQRLLEEQIECIKSAAVFVGKEGVGPWQQLEIEAFLREFVNRGCPVIPVLLPDAPTEPQLPLFLRGMTWVDFRQPSSQVPAPLERLVWGITGKRNEA